MDLLEYVVEVPLVVLGRSPYLGFTAGRINAEHAVVGSCGTLFGPMIEWFVGWHIMGFIL